MEKHPTLSTRFAAASLPLPFFGLALWRAWMNVTFVSPSSAIPLLGTLNHGFFDMVMLAVFVLGILFAKQLSPLTTKRWALWACVALMTPLSAAAWLSIYVPEALGLAVPLTVLASVGGTLMILLWSERYAGMPPYKVLIGLTGSYALAVAIVFVLNGFYPDYLAGFTMALPLASILLLARSRSLGYSVQGLVRVGRGTIPWRLVAIMALYSVAIGFSGVRVLNMDGAGSATVTFFVAATYFVCLLIMGNRSTTLIQRVPPLLMMAGFLAVLFAPFVGEWVAGPFIIASYLFYYFFVDTSLCDISKRFGISAVWLFSIEEAVSMGCEQLSQQLRELMGVAPLGSGGQMDPLIIALLAVVALAGAAILLDAKSLRNHWGIRFLEEGKLQADSDRAARVSAWVDAASADHGLSAREQEVLALLAEGKSLREVAQALVISEGTAKTHASHIYEKLGVRNKRDLQRVISELE